MSMGIAIGIVILVSVIGGAIAWTVSDNKDKSVEPKVGRRGVYYSTYHWYSEDFMGDKTNYSNEYALIVQEVDRVSDQSKIKIIDIDFMGGWIPDGQQKWLEKTIEKRIGNWIKTNKIQWDKEEDEGTELSEIEQTVETPLDRLVRKVQMDDIEGM